MSTHHQTTLFDADAFTVSEPTLTPKYIPNAQWDAMTTRKDDAVEALVAAAKAVVREALEHSDHEHHADPVSEVGHPFIVTLEKAVEAVEEAYR